MGLEGLEYRTTRLTTDKMWKGVANKPAEVADPVIAHALLTVTHGATGAIVGTTNVQTLSGKTLTAPTLVNANAGAPQAATAFTALHVAGADAAIVRSLLDAYAGCPAMTFRRANGTAAAPTVIVANDQLGEMSIHGRGATGYCANGAAHIRCEADGNWTDASEPTRWIFDVTPAGAIIEVEAMRIASNGYVGIGETDPDCRFHVKGTHVGGIGEEGIAKFEGTTHGYVYVLAATGSEAGYMFGETATRIWQIKQMPTTHTLDFATSEFIPDPTASILRLKANGQVTYPTSVDSAAIADEVSVGGFEISAGHRALAISSEEVVVVGAAGASDCYVPIRYNGATYKLLLHT